MSAVGIGHNSRRVEMTLPQFQLVTSKARFPALVAGFGSGKTEALVNRAIALKRRYMTNNIAYYMPTFDLVRQTAFPRFEEKLIDYGYSYKLNKSLAEIDIEGCGKIIFRTMDNPARIVSFEVCDSLVDELDTLKIDDARTVFRKILSRNRQKKPDGAENTIAVGTTPEGFRFVYEQWGKDQLAALAKGYQLIRASTYSNARNLPEGYIQSLIDLYPPALISAYIDGDFVNLTSGSVYPTFSRYLNGSFEEMLAGEMLHIGLDFNVGKMAGTVWVIRKDDPHCVHELSGLLDTPDMIAAIKRRFPNSPIAVYPDASAASRKTVRATTSDMGLLAEAGFIVCVNHSNPAVKDRLLSMNVVIAKRRLRVNVANCPNFVDALEKQAFDKKGEPDKTSGYDHLNDAGGYFICYRYPVLRPSSQNVKIVGV